jgi:hypothetical protein
MSKNKQKSSTTGTLLNSGNVTISSPANNWVIQSNSYTISQKKITYKLFDSEIELPSDFSNVDIPIVLAGIECNGWRFYESLQKNNVHFTGELREWLDSMYQQYLRDNKITQILETKQ